jgi:hypothetical protein
MMLHEKKPCITCGNDTTRDLRTCTGCREPLCRHCIREHVCGEDGRPELVQLLDAEVTDCEDASALMMVEIFGVLVAYIPRRRTISRRGLEALIAREQQRAKPIPVLAKNISEALCSAPLSARGAICFAASEGFYSMFAAKKADTPEVIAQFRAMMEARRLVSF